jgi:putative membrane protein
MNSQDKLTRPDYGSTAESSEGSINGDDATADIEEQPVTTPPVNLNTRFAADRTYMAADRTAIAWVRTAISMIGFGVTIAKTADVLQKEGLIENSEHMKFFGVVFVSIAGLGLILVVVQNIAMERRLAASGFGRVECLPLGLSMAVIVLLVGVLGALVIFHPIGGRQ